MNKIIRKPLADAIAKYYEIQEKIAGYRTEHAEAEATLARLERDDFEDIDEAARLSVDSSKVIQELEFKIASTERKLKNAKDNVETEAAQLKSQFNDAELEVVRKRLDSATAIIKSPEFEAFKEQLVGLYSFGGFYSWESLLSDVLPSEPGFFESKAVAERLFGWPEDPELPREIRDAKIAIGNDNDDRPPMFQKKTT